MKENKTKPLKYKLLKIIKKQAFFKGKFRLSSGKQSSFYIDGRLVTLSAEGAFLTAKIILEMIKGENINAIGGPTLGADPIVGAIALLSYLEKNPINTFIIRKIPKAHGRMRLIEGPLLKEESRVILIDDVATTGKSLIQSIEILKKSKVKVVKAICLIDRQEGAKLTLKKANCPLVSIFKASNLLK